MDVDALHIVIATGIVIAWLVIVFGWLCTCRHGEKSGSATDPRDLIDLPPSRKKPAA